MKFSLILACSVLAVFSATDDLFANVLSNPAIPGAVCIDGSAPVYYYRAAKTATDKFLIGFLGGGWCVDPNECYQRSMGVYGSSVNYPPSIHGLGLTSGNATLNPTFHDYNIAFLWYCDGASYAGNLEKPYTVNGKQLYSRGARIWESVLLDLEHKHNLDKASQVVLYGESAGGVACYTHLDKLASRWTNVDVRGLCDSAFFMPQLNFPKTKVTFLPRMKSVYEHFNVTASYDQDCLKAFPKAPWHCWIAQDLYSFIDSKLFVLQSQFDCDQMQDNDLGCLPAPDNKPANKVAACNATQISFFNDFGNNIYLNFYLAGALNNKKQNGYYFDACIHHSIALFGNYWNNPAYHIRKTTAAHAVKDWLAGKPAQYADVPVWHSANPECVAAFKTCLGNPSAAYRPWQCGPAKWQAHDC